MLTRRWMAQILFGQTAERRQLPLHWLDGLTSNLLSHVGVGVAVLTGCLLVDRRDIAFSRWSYLEEIATYHHI